MHALKGIYYAENQIVKNLPQMIEAASDAELKKGLKQHLAETENQVVRLEQAFDLLGERPKGTKCPGIDGILMEGGDLLADVAGRVVTNAAVVASAQAVEHYEITRYGTLIAWAQELGKDEVVPLFERNLRRTRSSRLSPKPASTRKPRKAQSHASRRQAQPSNHPQAGIMF